MYCKHFLGKKRKSVTDTAHFSFKSKKTKKGKSITKMRVQKETHETVDKGFFENVHKSGKIDTHKSKVFFFF